MIGISVAESNEWESTLEFFNKTHDECDRFPFGEYFFTNIDNKKVIVYRSYIRKVYSAASTQYMIDKFGLEKIIVDTEAAGIAYVCKMNNVKILIIKGISDFPTDESITTKELSHEEQYKTFIKNIPIVMNKIYNEYINKVI